jgi:hypothetical protein
MQPDSCEIAAIIQCNLAMSMASSQLLAYLVSSTNSHGFFHLPSGTIFSSSIQITSGEK